MATKILLKKSSTGGGVPLTTDLEQGELAINLVDRKIYTKDNNNAIVKLDSAYVGSSAPANTAEGDLWYDTANDLLKAHNGTIWKAAGYQNLSELEDTTITSATTGDYLKYDGAAWVNTNLETDVEGFLSVTDAGGDGSLTYANGVFTYTGPSSSEVQAHFAAGTYTSYSTGTFDVDFSTFTTDAITEGTTNLFYTDARARAAVSVTDSGGDGSLEYDSNTGAITYTGPSAAEVRAHFTGGTGVTINNGEIAIGQSVGTSDNVTFNDITMGATLRTDASFTIDPADPNTGDFNTDTGSVIIKGNLQVTGTTTTVNSTEVNIGDSVIVLNADLDGATAPSVNGGFTVNRGSSADVSFVWNETSDYWDFDGQTISNLTIDGGSY